MKQRIEDLLTKEQIEEAFSYNKAFTLSDRDIERLWSDASSSEFVEIQNLKIAQHTLVLSAVFLKAMGLKNKRGASQAAKINEISSYLKDQVLYINKINKFQAGLINSLNNKLFEKEFRIRELEGIIEEMK